MSQTKLNDLETKRNIKSIFLLLIYITSPLDSYFKYHFRFHYDLWDCDDYIKCATLVEKVRKTFKSSSL